MLAQYHGIQLSPVVNDGVTSLSFDIGETDFGTILAVDKSTAVSIGLDAFLARMKACHLIYHCDHSMAHSSSLLMQAMTANSLSSYSTQWSFLLQSMDVIPPTSPLDPSTHPEMVLIPRGKFLFQESGVEIEGSDANGVDVQFWFENSPRKEHSAPMELGPFLMDKTLVRSR